ncbi:MAG TPA: PadR family transcriptional regulator [Gammaproteobacteria bacterium]|nr:PadR family transcriptional regulator [Gammaproteobacteria bacterium]
MDVKDLCLGALTYGEATGYDIKKFFESSFSHCFLAGYGSIYPALAELTAERFVTTRTVPGQGGPSRKIYRLTEAGRKVFLTRLRETVPQHKVKSEFLVLMHFAEHLPPERLDAILDERLDDIQRQLKLIQAFEGRVTDPDAPHSPGARFVCGFGKAVMAAASDYIHAHRSGLRRPGRQANGSKKTVRARTKHAQTASRNRGYPNA